MKKNQKKSHTLPRWLLGIIVGLFFLYLAIRDIPIHEVGAAISHADPVWIGAALIGVIINNLAKVWRWQVLLAERRMKVPFGLGLRAILVGQMLNYVLPARTGDISRAYLVGIQGTGTVYALGTIVLEKVFDTLLYGLLFIVTAIFFPLPAWVNNSGITLLIITGILIVTTFFLARYSDSLFEFGLWFIRKLPPSIQIKIEPRMQDAVQTLEIIRNGNILLALIVWSLIIWITAVLPNWAILNALNLTNSWLAAMTVLIFLQVIVSLPGVPGRVGIFQYACILALGLFDISETDAFSYGVLLQAATVLPVILGGVVSLGGVKWKPSQEQ
jgi:uncharacterized protein (TIRG00374 family)